jgi:Pyridine nucleotide-disulphide oxidoreductase
MTTSAPELPIAVIGAGPVGLAAAAHLIDKGTTPLVLEAGERVGANVLSWAHVRMFSPWEFNVDRVAVRLLEAAGWTKPPAVEYPTGSDLVRNYLEPLAALPALRPHIRLGARVTAISRLGLDRLKTAGREDAPFVLHVATADGEERVLARAAIDASGTVGAPNPLGADGLPAVGERALADRVYYGIPDVLGMHRGRYAGRRTLVVGSGHSAFTALLDFIALAEQVSGTTVLWAIRRRELGTIFGGGESDALPERGRLGQRLRTLVELGRVALVPGFHLDRLTRVAEGIAAIGGGQALPAVDEIVATTGFRPDLAMLRELRLEIDAVVECPAALASVIDPNVHSCGTVPPHGEDVLRQPEPGFYLAGMKSYGRAPNFLLLTGYEQVRSIVSALTGDAEGATRVELTLPETGVCSTGPLEGTLGVTASCCGGPAPASVDACCVLDAEAKAAGHAGCGCGSTGPEAPERMALSHGSGATGDAEAGGGPRPLDIVPLGTLRESEPAGRCCS